MEMDFSGLRLMVWHAVYWRLKIVPPFLLHQKAVLKTPKNRNELWDPSDSHAYSQL